MSLAACTRCHFSLCQIFLPDHKCYASQARIVALSGQLEVASTAAPVPGERGGILGGVISVAPVATGPLKEATLNTSTAALARSQESRGRQRPPVSADTHSMCLCWSQNVCKNTRCLRTYPNIRSFISRVGRAPKQLSFDKNCGLC